jgi:hypothetical protein
MAVLKLRNGAIVVTNPTATVVDVPDDYTYQGEERAKSEVVGQTLFFDVHPTDVDDPTKWKGGGHGVDHDVVEVLPSEDIKKYLKK